ncbi:MAG TPA: hypothetical protein VGN72_17295 [Tepidisphaeraceae bacterium]|jgi:Ca2+-binding RTX toxin-like protein|nr:hypothetical protein [Tepidisphaeraceae bacterium]
MLMGHGPALAVARHSDPFETLEERRLLSVVPALSGTTVTFDNSGASSDIYLRSAGGLLEYSTDGASWSADLDASAGGINSLSLAGGVTIDGKFDGMLRIQSLATGGGNFTVKAEGDVSVDGNVVSNGGNVSLTTEGNFGLAGTHFISTRNIGNGSDHANGASVGNSGNVNLRGQYLTLTSGSAVFAQSTGTFTAGSIDIVGDDSVDNGYFSARQWIKVADSGITITNATVKGGVVKVYSTATTDADFNDTSDEYNLDAENPSGDFATPEVLEGISAFIGLSIARSTSLITIGTGSNIVGSVIDVQSGAQTEARILTTAREKQLAFAFGQSKPTARIDVQNGATLTASGNLSLNTIADSTVSVSAKRGLLGAAKSSAEQSITIAVSDADIKSTATVAAGASLNSDNGSVTVKAKVRKDHNTGASAGAYEDGTFGVAVAVSLSTSENAAKMDGAATAGQNVHVLAESQTVRNDTSSVSGAGSGLGARIVLGVKGASSGVTSFISKKQPDQKPQAGGAKKLAVSAAFTYAGDTNTSVARVGTGATVLAKNGDVVVDSTLVFVPETSATSTVDSAAIVAKQPTSGNTKENSVSAAINIAIFKNDSEAYIGSNAVVDAKGRVAVNASIVQPYEIQWAQIKGVGDVLDKLNSNLGLQNGFFTSWAQSNAEGDKTGIAGSINFVKYTNDADAYIDTGAQVNQKAAYRGPTQVVAVTAKNDIQDLNLSGVFGVKILNAGGSKAGVGGSYLQVTQDNHAAAVIKSGATLYASGLLVRSYSTSRNISIAESGGKGGDYAVYGSFGLVDINNESIAKIDDGAVVTTGTTLLKLHRDGDRVPLSFDSNGDGQVTTADESITAVTATEYETDLNVIVAAEDASSVFNIGGGIAKGESVGVGFTAVITDVDRQTKAIVGNNIGETNEATGSLTTGGRLGVLAANTGTFDTHAIAATFVNKDATESEKKEGKKGGGKYGIGVSGAAAVNLIDDTTKALVQDAAVTAGGATRIIARDNVTMRTVTGGVAIAASGANSAGIAGAYSMNDVTSVTTAAINNSGLSAAGALTVNAEQLSDILAISAGVGGSVAGNGVGLAGSVSVNLIDNDTTASVSGSSSVSTTASGATVITAKDDSQIVAVAGAIAFGGMAGIGASIAYNEIGTDTKASIEGSDLNSAGKLDVTSTSDSEIQAIAAAIGASLGNMAGAAALTLNEIRQGTVAVISGKKTAAGVDATGDVTLNATNTGVIKSLAGNLAVNFGNAGVGGSGAWNDISGATTAGLESAADVNATGATSITAKNDATIQSISAGVSAAANSAYGGSLSLNRIRTTADAHVNGGSKLVAGNAISVTATDDSTIESLAGQVAFSAGTVAVGAAAAYNDIADKAYATIDGGTVTSDTSSVTVSAGTTGEIKTIAVSGSVSFGTVGVAGSVAVNLIANDTQATIKNTTVTAQDNVNVLANTDSDITFYGGVLAGGGVAGVGATAAINTIGNTTKALVQDSTINSKGLAETAIPRADGSGLTDNVRGLSVVATDTAEVDVWLGNVSGGIKVGIAGTAAVTLRDDTTLAEISGSTVNANRDGGNAATGTRVRALSKADLDSKAGGLALGGIAGIGATAGTVIDTSDTAAKITSSTVTAFGTVEAISNTRERLNNIVVSGGGSLTVGLAGSVSVVKVDTTNEAAIDRSTVKAGGNLTVMADDEVVFGKQADGTVTGILAGSIGIGKVGGGVGGTVLVNLIDNTTIARITDSSTDASGTTTVKADQFTDVVSYGAAAAGGLYVGIAGTTSVNSVSNTTTAKIEELTGTTAVNQTPSYKAASQHVNVQAVDNTTIESKIGAISGSGVLGAGASVDVTTIKNSTAAVIGGGTAVSAGGNVTVDADGTKSVNIITVAAGGGLVGVQGAVSVVYIGGTLSGEALSAVNGKGGSNATSELNSQSSTNQLGGDYGSESFVAVAKAKASGETSKVSVATPLSTTPATGSVTASIGTSATIVAGGAVNVTADDTVQLKQLAGAAAGGLLGIGGSVAIGSVKPSATATVATGSSIDAGGAVNVLATGKLNDSDARSLAGAAGVVGLGAAVSKLNSTTNATASLDGAVTRASSLAVNATTSSDNHASATGAAVGAGAVGVVISNAIENGSAVATLGGNARVNSTQSTTSTVGSVEVKSNATALVQSDATAAVGGIVSGSGADSSASSTPQSRATIGNSAIVHTTGGATVQSEAAAYARGDAYGINIGGISVGVSIGSANASPTLQAAIGNNVTMSTGGNLTVQAINKPVNNASSQQIANATSDATSAVGGLVGGNGATATATSNPTLDATIGDATLTVGGSATVKAESDTYANATSDGDTYGALAAGINAAYVRITAHAHATIAADASLKANGAVTVLADTWNKGNIFVDSGAGGVVSGSNTTADLDLNNDVLAAVGARAVVTAGTTVTIKAITEAHTRAETDMDAGGLASYADSTADIYINSDAVVRVGADAKISGQNVYLQAVAPHMEADAITDTNTYAADSSAGSNSKISLNTDALVEINSGATVTGKATLTIEARQNNSDANTQAKSQVVGFSGRARTTADNTINAHTDVNVKSGAKLYTKAAALTSYAANTYVKDSDATAYTVQNVVESIPIIGWIVSAVTKALKVESTNEQSPGVITDLANIAFDGGLYVTSESEKKLTVNADGTIAADSNVGATVGGSDVIVDDIFNDNGGTASFVASTNAGGGTLSGAGTIYLDRSLDLVDLKNYSNKNFVIGDIDFQGSGAPEPALTFTASNDHTYNTDLGSTAPAALNIYNDKATDVRLTGDISNPTGVSTIRNKGGNISQSNGKFVGSDDFILTADAGNIGTTALPINLRTEDGSITATAGGNVALSLTRQGSENVTLAGGAYSFDDKSIIKSISAGGNVDLTLGGGTGIVIAPVAKTFTYGNISISYTILAATEHSASAAWDLRTITANGNVNVTNTSTSALTLAESISSTNGTTTLRNNAGAIVGGNNTHVVAGQNINLVATGAIGSTTQAVRTNVGNGAIDASTPADIYLSETTGDLRAGNITSTAGNVTLTSTAGIVEASADLAADVTGNSVTLNAATVGTATQPLGINTANAAAGKLKVTATGNILVSEAAGDLTIDAITTGGTVTLKGAAGILDDADANAVDITAAALVVTDAPSLGTAADAIETSVAKLEANVGSGGLFVVNTGALAIGGASSMVGVTSAGVAQITTKSPLTVNENVNATGDITLTTTDAATAGDDLTITSGATVRSTGAAVTLRSGDDLTITAGATVQAATTVTLLADYGNADAGVGAKINVLGAVNAASTLIETNADADTVTVANVAAGNQTVVRTLAGNDTINFRGLAAQTTINAGSDADTINVGSYAGTTAFGTVDTITAGLTINGEDGNDTINVDDRADTTGDTALLTKVTLSGLFGTGGLLTYGTAEQLNIMLGAGDDSMVLVDTGAKVNVDAGNGADRFRIGPVLDEDGFVQDDVIDGVPTKGADIAGVSLATTLNGGEGNDYFLVNRNKAELTLNGDNGDDTFELNTAVDNVGTSTVTGGVGADLIQYLANAPVIINGGEGFDTLIVNGSLLDDHLVVTADSITVVGSREASFTGVEAILGRGKRGNDTFDVDMTVDRLGNAVTTSEVQKIDLEGNFGADAFNIRGVLGTMALSATGNEGNDTFIVGSLAPVLGGTVNKIQGVVSLAGGSNQDATADSDSLLIDDTGDTAANTGMVTATAVTGLGMGASGIAYATFESLDVRLGSGNDTLNIRSIHAKTPTVVLGGAGDDVINVGSLAPAVGGTVNAIAATLLVDGQGGADMMNVDDRAETAITVGVLTQTTLSGLSPAVISYAALETLNIDAGSAGDVFNVRGTSAVTNLNTNGGNDRIYVANSANVQAGETPAYLFGNLNDLAANLNINGGAGTQTLMVSDSTATAGDASVVLTRSSITGLAPSDITYVAAGNFFGGITVWAGQGADNATVSSTLNTAGGRTITTLNTGAGNDTATINLGATDGFFVANGQSGDDVLNGAASTRSLYLFGGLGSDTITGGAAADVIIADTGRTEFGAGTIIGGAGDAPAVTPNVPADRTDGVERLASKIYTIDPTLGGNDTVVAGAGNDIVLGGNGRDTIAGGADNDLVFGDHGMLTGAIDAATLPVSTGNMSFTLTSTDTAAALGNDDVIDGNDGADILLGQQGADTIRGGAGDDDIIGGHNVAGGSDAGDSIDGGAGNDAIAGDNAQIVRNASALSTRIRKLSSATLYNATGAPNVTTAPQLDPRAALERTFTLFDHSTTVASGTSGNDSIAGGAGDDKIFGQMGNDVLQGDGVLGVAPASAATDGHDYIEGNGGADVIYGNGGQDDLIGGSSSLYGLTIAAQRPDGNDTIYGGSGTQLDRYNAGDTSANGHADDADVILGDNGNIFRLIGNDGRFLHFNYDRYASLGIVVRGVQSVDYTAGGAASDIGGNDLLHGEAGDDTILGQAGNDVLFGGGQDDDLIGGAGHDRIYGGNGEDGVIGDDGIVLTSRNGLTETLSGVTTATKETYYSEAGPATGFWGYINGRLQKTVKLLAVTKGGNDVIYGGLGDDFLHAGFGDDAVSGAEATAAFYNTLPVSNFNVLGYNASTRKLAAYDANNPMRRIDGFLLNFDAIDAQGVKVNDGKDRIFGDWGHDWLVGGTGNDRLFGGQGDDVMNADDNHDTAGGLNNRPDAPAFADADFVYGGDGLDVLIANTGADRLYDWSGEFNSYLVPFSAFGEPTVSRSPSPQVQAFLLALGKEAGADQTLAEPTGELGLYTQKDPQWRQNTGAPRDPQPGNSNFARDTRGNPEDDRITRLVLSPPVGSIV